jgi:hypothetical protein
MLCNTQQVKVKPQRPYLAPNGITLQIVKKGRSWADSSKCTITVVPFAGISSATSSFFVTPGKSQSGLKYSPTTCADQPLECNTQYAIRVRIVVLVRAAR